ncbi:hypothetical protein GC105_15915 [Alkalibaculum sp. M08DMB]|uniref:DUF6385 domain-containing protein n=1 Tax=Alkalibaculum sporogenes TaxID=2655001 RepID=A0A6A7KCT0_9FIRM|nr:DUF6385 domain-containing protein [Alkalibaculum sporogenes]MPW27254.1 hypothetical protein [Alkalibaculum sporogenes]
MPGMPIFQDSPSQLKGQIYVLDNTTENVVPLQVDNTGSLAINGTVDLGAGSEVTLAPGAEVSLSPGTEVSLVDGTDIDNVASVTTVDTITNDVKVVNGDTELNVELSAGTNVIGKVESELIFTNVDAFGEAIPLTPQTISSATTVYSEVQDISKETSYNWFVKNTGTTSANQDITLKVELSPDGTNWLEDTGSVINVAHDTAKMITVTNFLQNTRFVITGGVDETTVISCFQAQH